MSDGFRAATLGHIDLVYRFALRLSGHPGDAEDLVQETYLRALRAFDRFDMREHGTKAWLLKILHNVFYTQHAQQRRRPTLLDDVDFDHFAAELERRPLPRLASGQLDWDHFDDELKAALQSLQPEYREVLLYWAIGDLSYKEIADVLNCPLGTVMSRLYRARQLLVERLSEYAEREGLRGRGM